MNNSLLKELCLTSGISGDESSVRGIVLAEIKDYADKITVDNLGNILVFKKGNKPAVNKLLISAHMDEVGFIVTDISSDGLLHFDCVGGVDRRVVLGDRVIVGKEGIAGVVGVKPIHLCSQDEASSIPEYEKMYIDIGADSKEQAEKYVSPGDSVCFEGFYQNNSSTVMSKALDDRAGCAIMIEMIKSELPYDMYFSFVVQEEVGLRGATVASFTVAPEYAIVLESTTAADLPFVEESKQVCRVGKGAVVSFMDKGTIYDKTLIKAAFNAAEKTQSNIQYKKAVAGGNDAPAIQKSRGGVKTVALSLPCRYLHSPVGLISVSDYESMLNITLELSKEICGGEI